jgi:hypothetical protein
MQNRMSDWTKVLVVNVVLAIATVVLIFHAPLLSAVLGASGAGAILWICHRRDDHLRHRH